MILASTLGSGDPQVGVPYLLSAYAAAFLGASQLRPGRFNAWGTLIAVLLLGTGVVGLGLVSAPNWAPAMFTGVVLIAALGITGARRRALRKGQAGACASSDIAPPLRCPQASDPSTTRAHSHPARPETRRAQHRLRTRTCE